MIQKLLQYIVICSICLVLPVSVSANVRSLNTHTFPKVANYYLSWEMDEATVRQLAAWDVVVLDMEVQRRQPQHLTLLRELNPDIVLIVYITPQEIVRNANSSYSLMRRELASRISNDMYLQNERNERLSWWQGTYLLNVTSDSAWQNTLLDFVTNDLLDTGYWDGVFYDNMWDNISYFVGNTVDTNLDGRVDASADAKWKQGMEYIYTQTKAQNPGKVILGNGSTGTYDGLLHGKMLENFRGHAAWSPTMNRYRSNVQRSLSPDVHIINANTNNSGSKASYQNMRFGLTSSLLENGYYSYDFGDQNHGQTWWYDEYDVNLGDALSDATSELGASSYTPDVWRRDFTNGISVVNSTNETKHVSLAGEYEKIHGTQDGEVNDGSIVDEVTLSPEDGIVLLKTFEDIEDIIFKNGEFARFFRPDGSRVRNGIFLFTEGQRGGVQIARIDLNFDAKPELIVVRGAKVEIYRDDGQLYSRFHPYGANYEGELRIAVGDLWGIKFKELFVAPSDGYPAPIKSYSYFGRQVRDDWYPFGHQYTGGYSLAVGTFNHPLRNHLAVGAGVGEYPAVHIYNHDLFKQDEWFAYDKSFRGGVFLATGDTNGDGIDEIVTGPGEGMKPTVRVFSYTGVLQSEFQAFTTLLKPGIRVQTADLDFDGKDDIVGLSSGVGL